MDAPLNIQTTLRNVLLLLQTEPSNYRNFGIYWWAVKDMLKAAYTRDNLYMLKDYSDPGAPAVPDVVQEELLRLALSEYASNARYGLGSNVVQDQDGGPYTLFDEDAGL